MSFSKAFYATSIASKKAPPRYIPLSLKPTAKMTAQLFFDEQDLPASHLSHPGSLRKPDMCELVRELCQAGGQSDDVTDDPLHEMEA